MFHHFHDEQNHLPSQGSINLSDLRKILDYAQNNYNLISPDEYLYKIRKNTLTPKDTCLSFDDCIKSQFDIAAPELNDRNISAFYFIYTSIYTDSQSLLEFNRDFRHHTYNKIDDYYYDFFLTFKNEYPKYHAKYIDQYTANYLSEASYYTDKDRRYRYIRDEILKSDYQYVVLSLMLKKNYSIEKRKTDLLMNQDNIKSLYDSGNTIGLHSHSHPMKMSRQPYKFQLSEYAKNKEMLESVIDQNIISMAHPCGNYNNDTLKILTKLEVEIGFRSTMTPSTINSPLEIPRTDHSILINLLK